MSIEKDHAAMVSKLAKPGLDVLQQLTIQQTDLLHAAVGISGEAGELLDAVKKIAIYQKITDRENIIEELGDLEFYMQQLRANLGISREETLQANIEKLSKRYSNGYSDAAAQERADKK